LFYLSSSVCPVLADQFCISCSAYPFLYGLFCLYCPVPPVTVAVMCCFPVLAVLSGSSVMAVLSGSPVWQFFLAIVFCQSCSACLIFCLPYSGCPIQLSCSACLVLLPLCLFRFCLFCSACPVLPVQNPIFLFLSILFCLSDLPVLF
jgi:hypothetical protein